MSFTTSAGIKVPWCIKRISTPHTLDVSPHSNDQHQKELLPTASPHTPAESTKEVVATVGDGGAEAAVVQAAIESVVPYGHPVGCANGIPAFSNGSDDYYSRSRSVFHVYHHDALQSFIRTEGLNHSCGGGGGEGPTFLNSLLGHSDELALKIVFGENVDSNNEACGKEEEEVLAEGEGEQREGLIMVECLGNQEVRDGIASGGGGQSATTSGLFVATIDIHNPQVRQLTLIGSNADESPLAEEKKEGCCLSNGKSSASKKRDLQQKARKEKGPDGSNKSTASSIPITPVVTVDTGVAWQCVEYARRWLLLTKGIWLPDVQVAGHILYLRPDQYQAIDGGKTNASTLSTSLSEKDVVNVKNRGFTCPVANSLIIYPQTRANVVGHVGVISEVILDDLELAERPIGQFNYSTPQEEANADGDQALEGAGEERSGGPTSPHILETETFTPIGWVRVADQNRFFHSWGPHHWSCEFRLVRNSIGQYIILDDEVECCGWVTFPSTSAPKLDANHQLSLSTTTSLAEQFSRMIPNPKEGGDEDEFPGPQGIWQGAQLAYVGYNNELIQPHHRAHQLKWTNHLRFHGASIFNNETARSLKTKYLPAFLL